MLTALDASGSTVLAWEVESGGAFFCPECQACVIRKAGAIVVEHFAHRPDESCGLSDGESPRHMQMKRDIGRYFEGAEYEKAIVPGHRADVVYGSFVIECQASALSILEWERRTRNYNRAGYRVVWVWDSARLGWESRNGLEYAARHDLEMRIPAEMRNCHRLSYGHLYLLDEDGSIFGTRLWSAETRTTDYDGGHDYTPKTLKRVSVHRITDPIPWRLDGPNGHKLASFNEGVWWKRATG